MWWWRRGTLSTAEYKEEEEIKMGKFAPGLHRERERLESSVQLHLLSS